jgi:hypothetical protein
MLRMVTQFIHQTPALGKYLLMSCPAAKSTTHIENHSISSASAIATERDLGSLSYRLLHHGISFPTATTNAGSLSSEDSHLLSLQILEALIRGTNQESWSPAIRSILSQSILTHLKTHFIHFSSSNANEKRFPPQFVSHLLSLLCSCLLAPLPPASASITDSNFDQQPQPQPLPKGSGSSNLHHLSTSTLSLPELIQWFDDRYLLSSSPPAAVLLTALYSFLSRISYSGASDKLYSHHNRKLCSTLFTNDQILRILKRSLQSHLPLTLPQEAVNQHGLVALWMILYSSESVRGKWKKLMNEQEQSEDRDGGFDWRYFLTTHLTADLSQGDGGGKEERKEKKESLSLTDQAILSITSLISSSR